MKSILVAVALFAGTVALAQDDTPDTPNIAAATQCDVQVQSFGTKAFNSQAAAQAACAQLGQATGLANSCGVKKQGRKFAAVFNNLKLFKGVNIAQLTQTLIQFLGQANQLNAGLKVQAAVANCK